MVNRVLFLFHMHQPYYKDTLTGESFLPWVRLHATKGYFDIPYFASKCENAVFTVNLVPSLMEQLLEYAEGKLTDRYLELTLKPPSLMSDEEKLFVIDNFFSVNKKNFIYPNKEYLRLFEKRGESDDKKVLAKKVSLFSEQEIRDLQALFNLSWFGFAAEREYSVIRDLKEKGSGYSQGDIEEIVRVQFDIVKRLIPLYRDLYREGKIELTVSPYFHPILPLLIDTDIAKRCMDRKLPESFSFPEHAKWHLREALDFFENVFGHRPSGVWPSEGSVSPEVLDLFAELGIKWTATDEGILEKSLDKFDRAEDLYTLYRYRNGVFVFFRDRELSDKVGFVYYNVSVEDAVSDFISGLEDIRVKSNGKDVSVAVILDGENPWENYRDGGFEFLQTLFDAFKREGWKPDTFSNALNALEPRQLDFIHSGSWINSDFAIWIGHEETNKAWTYLKKTADFFESKKNKVDEAAFLKAKKELMIAEGSDWFWWYVDDFQVKDQDKFDFLFLKHLSNVYLTMGENVPNYLKTPIKKISFEPVKMPSCVLFPEMDGRISNFFEWSGSGVLKVSSKGDTMYKGEGSIREIRFGQDGRNCYFLILVDKLEGDFTVFLKSHSLFKAEIGLKRGFSTIPLFREKEGEFEHTDLKMDVAIDEVIEICVPLKGLVSNKESLKVAFEFADGFDFSRVPNFGFADTGITAFLPPFFFCSFDF